MDSGGDVATIRVRRWISGDVATIRVRRWIRGEKMLRQLGSEGGFGEKLRHFGSEGRFGEKMLRQLGSEGGLGGKMLRQFKSEGGFGGLLTRRGPRCLSGSQSSRQNAITGEIAASHDHAGRLSSAHPVRSPMLLPGRWDRGSGLASADCFSLTQKSHDSGSRRTPVWAITPPFEVRAAF